VPERLSPLFQQSLFPSASKSWDSPHFFLSHPKNTLYRRTERKKSFQWKDLARGQVAGLVFLPKIPFLVKPTHCHHLATRFIHPMIPAFRFFLISILLLVSASAQSGKPIKNW
jgi:hypothetical protein